MDPFRGFDSLRVFFQKICFDISFKMKVCFDFKRLCNCWADEVTFQVGDELTVFVTSILAGNQRRIFSHVFSMLWK